MRIGIDFTSAARERAGIGRYARELIRAVARLDRSNGYVLFVPWDAHPDLLAFPGEPEWPRNFTIRRFPLTERVLAALWHRARVPVPVEAWLGRVDVFYSPDFLLPPTRARKTIVTVHDLSYVRVPDCFPAVLRRYLDRAVPRAVERADLVLADAASTQRDLIDVYKLPPGKIKVVYSGVDDRFCPQVPEADRTRIRERYGLNSPYVLSVGTIQPRKNYARLIQAFARVLEADPTARAYRLVISGGNGWMYDEVYQAARDPRLSDHVVFTGFTREEDLPALYGMATVFVLPSLYEGFGLPVAEAMACGVPVVSSRASSLPEVAGDAAVYFDPSNVDSIAQALQRVLADPSLRAQMTARGLAQVRQFSWKRAAEQLLGHLTTV